MSDASGRVVVLSGATSGIGEAAARALAEVGARLTLVGRNEALLQAAGVRARRGDRLGGRRPREPRADAARRRGDPPSATSASTC